jgi:hypothetical protein
MGFKVYRKGLTMSESSKHMELVSRLFDYICQMTNVDCAFVFKDSPENAELPQPTSEGFRPDVYYEHQNILVIGEAKTEFDIRRNHSLLQYEAFLKRCSLHDGDSCFVLAVPWTEYNTAKNLIRRIKKKSGCNVNVYIINDINRAESL